MLQDKEDDPQASPIAAAAPVQSATAREPQTKKPSKEEIARAIRLRNSGGRYSELTPADVDIARKLSYSAALESEPDATHKVQIVIRIRPLDEPQGDTECFRVLSDASMLAQPPKTSLSYRSTGAATAFRFSRIFRPDTQQQELFEETARPVLTAALAGQSGLVFAYGVTNSGKTYTISGSESEPGVLPRALRFIVHELERRRAADKGANDAQQPIAKVTASYLEIYNENVYDLIPPAHRKRHPLRLQDCDGKIQVKGATEREISSLAEGEEILAMGRRNKQVAETKSNSDSSRSHCVFTFHFYQQTRGRLSVRSKVSIVDLAGSERSAKTGAKGLRIQEASKINGSLMNLMRCLETLRWNQQHPPNLQKMVPFRESKLTRLFQENLIGRKHGPLVMIVAVNPSGHEFDETLRTLKYSAVARELVHVRPRPSPSRKSIQPASYDQNGRLRKRKRASTVDSEASEAPQPPALPASARRPPTSASASSPASKVGMMSVATSPMETQRSFQERELRWAKTELEVEELRLQVAELTAEKLELTQLNADKLLQQEVQLRAEIVNEMRDQMEQIRAHYQAMAARHRHPEDLPSARKKRERQHVEETERLRSTVSDLREKLKECEDEMRRMDKRHKIELEQARGS